MSKKKHGNNKVDISTENTNNVGESFEIFQNELVVEESDGTSDGTSGEMDVESDETSDEMGVESDETSDEMGVESDETSDGESGEPIVEVDSDSSDGVTSEPEVETSQETPDITSEPTIEMPSDDTVPVKHEIVKTGSLIQSEMMKKYDVKFAYSFNSKSVAVQRTMTLYNMIESFFTNRSHFVALTKKEDLDYVVDFVTTNKITFRSQLFVPEAKRQFLERLTNNTRYYI